MTKTPPVSFTSKQKKILGALAGAVGLRMLGLFLILPVFTLYGLEFTPSRFLVGLAFGIYGMAVACTAIPMGRLSDRVGRRRILILGMSVFSLGSFLCAIPGWFPPALRIGELIVGRFIQGMGTITSTAFATVADHIPEERRSTGFAFLGIPIGVAFILGVIGGPVIAGLFRPEWLFWITGILGTVTVLVLARSVPETPPRRMVLTPVTKVLKSRRLIMLDGGGFLMNTFMTAFWFFFPLILTQRYHLPLTRYWVVLVPMMLASGATMFLFSKGADLGWGRSLTAAAFLIMLISAFLLFRPSAAGLSPHHLAAVLIPGSLFLIGFTGLEPILPSLVTRATHETSYGTAMGSFQTLQYFGSFAGGALAGALAHFSSIWPMAFLMTASILGAALMLLVPSK
ncbi:MAG: MFS transporter [Terriglobia bacterium]